MAEHACVAEARPLLLMQLLMAHPLPVLALPRQPLLLGSLRLQLACLPQTLLERRPLLGSLPRLVLLVLVLVIEQETGRELLMVWSLA